MLKTLKLRRQVHNGLQKVMVQKRLFLSEAYRCEEAWNRRLQSPLLKDIKPTNWFLELEHKYTSARKVSALDIDIFANTVADTFQTEELLTYIHNLRLTAEATNTLDSTHHAVIRFLLKNECSDDLINILHDRLNYGIFPDHWCYNVLMDTYIRKKEYGIAAKVAVLPMLQEDSEHVITNALSAYCCHRYLEHKDQWQKPEIEVDDGEEVKVRVAYIRNPYFDDHFDLTDPQDLVGKTLAYQGKHMNNVLGRSCQLRGLILYKKYKDASELLQGWLKGTNETTVYKEVLELIKQDTSNMSEDQITDEFTELQSRLKELESSNLCDGSIHEALETNVKSAVEKQAERDISEQCETYLHWEQIRETRFNDQLREINQKAKMKEIEKMKEDLQNRERLLTFFENEEKIELQIERQKIKEAKEMERVAKVHKYQTKLKRLGEEGKEVLSYFEK